MWLLRLQKDSYPQMNNLQALSCKLRIPWFYLNPGLILLLFCLNWVLAESVMLFFLAADLFVILILLFTFWDYYNLFQTWCSSRVSDFWLCLQSLQAVPSLLLLVPVNVLYQIYHEPIFHVGEFLVLKNLFEVQYQLRVFN